MVNEKVTLRADDVFGMYVTENAEANAELQMRNCCQTCQAGKC